jgi:hypothetical protein
MVELPISSGGRRYGALPQPPDRRDLKFKLSHTEALAEFPRSTNNRVFCGPIKDQGNEGSCTAHGWTSLRELEYRKFKKKDPVFSPQFLYYEELRMEGSLPNDNGAMPRTGAKVWTQLGCCLAEQDPYDTSKFTVPPTSEQLSEALQYKDGAYHSIIRWRDVKGCLADLPGRPGHPFTLSFDVPSSFEGDEIANKGFMVYEPGDFLVGGHLTLAVDYDDGVSHPSWPSPGALLVQNSWGSQWGYDIGGEKRGFFWFPYFLIFGTDIIDPLVSAMIMLHFGKPW